jgi:sugar-specific transcriptional regulator TrmB
MGVEEEATQILNRLGLTGAQAKVYLALLKLEKATAKTISDNSKVARQEVYRILVELEAKSLVERIIAVPNKFKPVSIEKGLSFLIGEKREEVADVQKEANKLSIKIRTLVKTRENKRGKSQTGESEFVLIPENKALLLRMEKAVDATQKSIAVIYPKEPFLQLLFNLSDKFKDALERGVKIRCLLNEPLEANSCTPATVQAIADNPLFEIRIISETPKENFWIYDEKEVFVSTCPVYDYRLFPVLWTTATPLIGISENYFNTLWKKAAKVVKITKYTCLRSAQDAGLFDNANDVRQQTYRKQ